MANNIYHGKLELNLKTPMCVLPGFLRWTGSEAGNLVQFYVLKSVVTTIKIKLV